MPHPTISLVVPFRDSRQMMGATLESIAAQPNFGDLAVILVDDGSVDGTAGIVADFAAAHDNVRVITQANAGVGAARNAALAEVDTVYVAFLDAEDILPEGSLATMHREIESSGADVVVGLLETFPKKSTKVWMRTIGNTARTIAGVEAHPELLLNASVCNKLFRTALVKAGPQFGVDVYSEDAYVTVPQLLRADSIRLIPDTVYIHRRPVRHVAGDAHLRDAKQYRDSLSLVEFLRGELPSLTEAKQRALTTYELRKTRVYLHSAPRYMTEDELTAYFARAKTLFGSLSPQALEYSSNPLSYRITFAAIATDSYEAFRAPETAITGLRIEKEGEIFADLPGIDVPEWRATLQVTSIGAWADGLAAAPGDDAHFYLRVMTDGLDVTTQFMKLKPRLAIDGPGKPVRLKQVPRGRRTLIPGIIRFEVPVPVEKWAQGTWPLSIELTDALSAYTRRIPVRSTVGMDMSSRSFRQGPTMFQALVGHNRRLRIRIRKGKNLALRWKLRSALSDGITLVQRKPLSGWKLLRLLTLPFFSHRKITLICERTDTAQDNGYHLFRALRTQAKPADAYYVIARDSAQRSRVTPFGHVLNYDGFLHKLFLLHAHTLVSSNSINSYLIPRSWDLNKYRTHLAPRLEHRRVYLRHGVSLADIGWIHDRSRSGLDVILSSNEREREDVEKTTGYGSEVALTGLPRFDALIKEKDDRQVLVMPTWRRWLVAPSSSRAAVDPGTFEGSEYQEFYDSLLVHPRLIAALHQYDYRLKFYPHYGVASYFAGVEGRDERVDVVTTLNADLQETLKASSMLVTDFSSVSVDAGYLGIPIVYAQFDEKDFYEFHYKKGWMDYRTDGFGPVASDLEETVDRIIEYLAAECRREDFYSDRIPSFFAHHDTNNTARVIERISQL